MRVKSFRLLYYNHVLKLCTKFWNFQSLYAERPFAKFAVVDDEKTETSSGDGIAEKSREYPGETKDVQSK